MRDILNFDDAIIEPFAVRTITHSYDSIYNDFIWNKKADDFDFVHHKLGIGLEVSVIITKNIQTVVSYQNSHRKNLNLIKQVKTDENGKILSYYGGSLYELRKLIIDRILRKNTKAKRHLKNPIETCQLCLCVDDGGLFEYKEEFDFLFQNKILENTIFNKIFIITRSLFLVYENGAITSLQRKLS